MIASCPRCGGPLFRLSNKPEPLRWDAVCQNCEDRRCERCFAAPAVFHVESDLGPQYLKLDVCLACAEQARKLGMRVWVNRLKISLAMNGKA